MKFLTGFLALFFSLGISSFTAVHAQERVPVIVELFTSEGCETCPPADKYLQKIIREQPIPGVEIIAMSEHVDYWNGPTWVDRFSSKQFSNRQKYYEVFFKRSDIFTPQFVVDGVGEMTSKSGTDILVEAAKTPKVDVSVKIEKASADSVILNIKVGSLPSLPNTDKAVALVAVMEDSLASNVSGGENNGRKLEHWAVVRYLKTIAEVHGHEKNLLAEIELGKDWRRENLSIVAFVQQAQGRRILGAAKTNLSKQHMTVD